MAAEDILSQPPPAPDQRVAYGADPNQFLEVRLPRGKGPSRTGRDGTLSREDYYRG